jgi:hypothetical protein
VPAGFELGAVVQQPSTLTTKPCCNTTDLNLIFLTLLVPLQNYVNTMNMNTLSKHRHVYIKLYTLYSMCSFIIFSTPFQTTSSLLGKADKHTKTEPVLLNVYGAPELILRNEFRQPM